MKPIASLAARLIIATGLAGGLSGCAQSGCSQPDVLAFVDKALQSRDLYAIGLTEGNVRETPIVARQTGQVDRHRAACSAPLMSRNPSYQPGNGQARYLYAQQSFWVQRLASGYEVGIYRK